MLDQESVEFSNYRDSNSGFFFIFFKVSNLLILALERNFQQNNY